MTEPQPYKEVIASPQWQLSIADKHTALQKNQTWDIIPLPPGKHTIGCKWVFKIKNKFDSSIDHYKARLVAKGHNQEYGVDYEETFALVIKMTTVRRFISVATIRQWAIFQLNVKNAFLNGFLSEEIFMTPPLELVRPPHHVCRLKGTLYGLK